MSALVICEHQNNQADIGNLSVINAAMQLADSVDALVVGSGCQSVAEQTAKVNGVNHVLIADADVYQHQLAENVAALIASMGGNYSHILMPASTFGKNILPRVAALLDVNMLSDIVEIQPHNTFKRSIYAGNAFALVQTEDPIKLMTVRVSAFAKASVGDTQAPIKTLDSVFENNLSEFVKADLSVSERPDLSAARVVISGGRGLQSGDNFKLLESIADRLNAAIGASRAAVDAGFVPNDMQVGQTGKIVAPELYIAVGISGAIQHLAGMKDSKVIVAINKDPDAPIFQIADYGIVGDLFEILPQLDAELERRGY